MLNYSKFPEYPVVYSQYNLFTLQGTASTPPPMSLVTPELLIMLWVTSLDEHCHISQKITNSGSFLNMVTHQTLYSTV